MLKQINSAAHGAFAIGAQTASVVNEDAVAG